MNKIILIGRLTKDPDLRATKSGKSVTSFALAVNRRDDGTDFINCVAWEKTAELMQKYCHRSDRIGITGRLSTREYEGKNGKMTATEVIVEELDLLEPKKKEDGFPF